MTSNDAKKEETKKESAKKGSFETIICGGVAGLVSRFCIAPLDVVKIRLQLQTHSTKVPAIKGDRLYNGIYHGLTTIIKQEGITGLWKGNVAAELLYVTYGASQFLAYREATRLCDSSLPKYIPKEVHSFIAGAVAGSVATTLTYPFDLLRTRFAAQGQTKVYESLSAAIKHTAHHEGLGGFYRGLTASIVQIVPYMGLLFGTYEPARLYLHHVGVQEGWDNAIAGFVAGTLSKTGVFPLDVIRKRLQVQGPTRGGYVLRNIPIYTGSWSCARRIVQIEGFRSLYKGLLVSLMKAAPSSAITLWTFEQSYRVLQYFK